MKAKRGVDVETMSSFSRAVADWARYQNIAGDMDLVETSTVRGNYDWRSYLQEETSYARRREARARKAEPRASQAPAPAPHNLYA